MTAQEQLIKYAEKHNTGEVFTHQEFIGKAATEGVCIARTSESKTICNIKRQGKTITITETTITKRFQVVNGKMIDLEPLVETAEVAQINL